MKKVQTIVITIVILFGTIGFSTHFVSSIGEEDESIDSYPLPEISYTSHSPILIQNNTDFADQAALEGWSGDGSAGNPYMIENYNISASSAHGIHIINTTVHFVIRDSYIEDGGSNYDGINCNEVYNGTISNNTILDNNYGIYLEKCNSTLIKNNNVSNSGGIRLKWCYNNKVCDNIGYNNHWSFIDIGLSQYNEITNNKPLSGNTLGISLMGGAENNSIKGNYILDGQRGLNLHDCSNNILESNFLYKNDIGIQLGGAENNTLIENDIINNDEGFCVDWNGHDNLIYHNNLIQNNNQVEVIHGENIWDNGYPSGGNYWSDYSGVDKRKGPDQNKPGSDGIGDTEYVVSGSDIDDYPLMKPWDFISPEIIDNTNGTPTTGENFTLNATVTDNIMELDSVYVGYWFDGGSIDNVSVSKTGDYWRKEIEVPSNVQELHYVFHANDTSNNWASTEQVDLDVEDNDNPTADAGPDKAVNMGEEVVLNGSGSWDNVGIESYTWNIEGKWGEYDGKTVSHTFYESGLYKITLVVTDFYGNSDEELVNVTVLDTESPNADAGPNQTVEMGEPVMFDASLSSDNVGIVKYIWNFTYDEEFIELEGKRPQYLFDIPGEYEVSLTVEDAEGTSDDDSMFVTVTDTEPPNIEITKPVSGTINLTYERDFTIEGVTEVDAGVEINNKAVSVDNTTGEFSYTTTLQYGMNVFDIVASDEANNTSMKRVYGLYLPDIPSLYENISILQNDIGSLNDTLKEQGNNLKQRLDENITALYSAMSTNDHDLLNSTQENITALQVELDSLILDLEELNDDKESTDAEQDSKSDNLYVLGIIALIIGIVALIISIYLFIDWWRNKEKAGGED